MVSFIPIIIWTIIISFSVIKTKSDKLFITLLFLPLFIYPTIQIGSARISSLYYVCVCYLILVLICRKKNLSITTASYIGIALLILCCYILGWASNGVGGIVVPIIGFAKFLPIIMAMDLLLNHTEQNALLQGFQKALDISVCIDFIVALGQIFQPTVTSTITDYFFYNDETINFSDVLLNEGFSSRIYGIFNHPSTQAVFCLIVFSFYLTRMKERSINRLFFIISIFMGLASCSKTFILGAPIILILWFIINFRKIVNLRIMVAVTLIALFCLFVFVNFDDIMNYIRSFNPVLAYYLNYLKSPIEALNTRYSIGNGNLSPMYSIIENHLIIGVGPNAISGEEVLDSAPLVILHNGGILALVLFLILFVSLLRKSLKYKQEDLIYMLTIIFISGFAIPTWIFHAASLSVTVYVLLKTNLLKTGRASITKTVIDK